MCVVRCVRESRLWVVCAIVILAICDMDSPGVVHLDFCHRSLLFSDGGGGASISFSSFEFSNSWR